MKTFFLFLENITTLGRKIAKSEIDSEWRPFFLFFREHYDFGTKNREIRDRFWVDVLKFWNLSFVWRIELNLNEIGAWGRKGWPTLVYNNARLLPFCPTPTYFGVKLDRSLTFRHHLVALRKKLSSRVTLMRRLVGSGWGAGAKTIKTLWNTDYRNIKQPSLRYLIISLCINFFKL